MSGAVHARDAEAAGNDVEWVSGSLDGGDPWSSAGFPVPAAPTSPDQARYSVYATKVLAAPDAIYIRDYDTIVRVDPVSGMTQRVAGFYASPITEPPYPTIPDGVGQDSLSVGTSWTRSLGLLADGRLIFDTDSSRPHQVFAASPTGGTIEAFAGDGTNALPTPGALAISTGLDEPSVDDALFGTASGGAWIVGGSVPDSTSSYAHHVASDGTVTTQVIPTSSPLRTVVGDDLVTVDMQNVSADPASMASASASSSTTIHRRRSIQMEPRSSRATPARSPSRCRSRCRIRRRSR